MSPYRLPRRTSRSLAVRWGSAIVSALIASSSTPAQLDLRFTTPTGKPVQTTASNLWLHANPASSPHPLLPSGPFTATWNGFVQVDLRGDYHFHAEPPPAPNSFRLEINGQNVPLSPDGTSPTVRLRKGTNSLRATFQPSVSQPAQLRLLWQSRGLPRTPIPNASLLPPPTPPADVPLADRALRGRRLFLELRCGKCHTPAVDNPVPELAMDAPRFEGIGSVRPRQWLETTVLRPDHAGPHATMPRLLHGPEAGSQAEAIADWLSSLTAPPPTNAPSAPGNTAIGKAIAERLLCTACHRPPDSPNALDPADTRIPWDGLEHRFLHPRTLLPEYLRQPSARYTWTRMPTYRLTADEARHLAEWLLGLGSNPSATPSPPSPPVAEASPTPARTSPPRIAQGRELVETLGCLRCHTGPATDRSHFKSFAQLDRASEPRGCLSHSPTAAEPTTAPTHRAVYALSPRQIDDLRAFLATGPDSLGRHVPAEFAQRWLDTLRCRSCHEATPGLPSLTHAGEKLRPEWMTRLLAGRAEPKSRPWLPSVMPAFPAYADYLAPGISARHGLGPASPAEPAIDLAAAADGRKLVSASGGLACVSCHAVGSLGASAVFEAPGINLARVSERILPEYFHRWLLNPQLVDPETKMPLYFDEDGNTALAEFYGGDGARTLHALWNYLRLGPRMEPPPP